MTELWDEHQRFRGSRCWKAMKMAMPITDTTTSIAPMVSIAETSPDERRWQSVINYRLKFSGIVVSVMGRECGPVNPKISAGVRLKNK
jgi:hypothetical protein